MTLKGEIEKHLKLLVMKCSDTHHFDREIDKATLSILSAIKGRVPKKKPVRKENSQPLGMSELLDNIKNQGFNEARNQFINEVEG